MQKVYLLLRSNQQTGPFSLDEVLQFDLKPHDLIWVEGRSAGWYYPQEIEALRPHLSFLKKAPEQTATAQPFAGEPAPAASPAAPKKIFVAMPSGNTPKETLAAQQKPVASAPIETPSFREPEPAELKTTYAKSLEEVETEYMNWAYSKKAKKKSVPVKRGVLAAGLLVAVAFAAWWFSNPSVVESSLPVAATQSAVALPAELAAETEVADQPVTQTQKSVSGKKQNPRPQAVAVKDVVAKPKMVKQRTEEMSTPSPATPNDYEVKPTIKEEPLPPAEKSAEPVTTEAPKQKKKVTERIADLFRKKPEEKNEEATGVEEEDGRRQSTRREAGSDLAQLVTVRFEIPNDWMMGIKGAKATLSNRSNETISKAVVQIIYYNDDGDLLEKKTIAFGNIKAKQTQTVSVPDHQTAPRLEYSVVSATGPGEPLAKR